MVESIVKFLAQHAIAVLMLTAGLMMTPRAFHRLRADWRLFLRGLGVLWLAVPALALLVVMAVRPPPLGGTTLLLMAICPGVPLVLTTTRKAGGDVSTAGLLLLLTAVTAPIMVPLWGRVLAAAGPYGAGLAIGPVEVLEVLLPTVLAPLVVGFVIARLAPRAAGTLARIANALFLVGLVLLLAGMFRAGLPLLGQVSVSTYVAMALITFGAGVLGYVAGGPRVEDAEALGFAAVLGNPALALAIMTATYPDLNAGAPIAAYVVIRTLLLVPYKRAVKARHGRAEVPPAAAPAPGR